MFRSIAILDGFWSYIPIECVFCGHCNDRRIQASDVTGFSTARITTQVGILSNLSVGVREA